MGQCQVVVEEYFSNPNSSFKILLNSFKTPTARCKAWQSTRMFGCLLPPFHFSVSASFPAVVESQSISIVDRAIAGMYRSGNERCNSVSVLILSHSNALSCVSLESLVNVTPPDNVKLLSVLATHSIPSLVEAICDDGCFIQVECCRILVHRVPRQAFFLTILSRFVLASYCAFDLPGSVNILYLPTPTFQSACCEP
uniref:Prolamin_like domain-containing protein n=1 Tax=Echinococcus granulosus TaxID=6210 RepID=A0A068WQN1_ECHGR|nr:hypothetical protein EgrG_000363700 [Echinococcus granulosus]